MKRLFLSLALLFSAAFLHAADGGYSFNHYQTRDGLTSNTVYCTMQDGNGFIWIGTDDGICVYDGYRFIYWGTVDPDTMMRGMSTAVCVDADGLVWFSTVAGCGFFNPVTNETVNVGIHERVPASTIVVDAGAVSRYPPHTLVPKLPPLMVVGMPLNVGAFDVS